MEMYRDWQNSALLFLPPSLSSLPSSFPLSLVSIHPFFLFPLFPSLSLASLKLKFSKRQRMLESPSWTAGRNVIIAQKEAMLSLACTRQGRREHCNSQGLVLSQGLRVNCREPEGPWGVLLPPFPHPRGGGAEHIEGHVQVVQAGEQREKAAFSDLARQGISQKSDTLSAATA